MYLFLLKFSKFIFRIDFSIYSFCVSQTSQLIPEYITSIPLPVLIHICIFPLGPCKTQVKTLPHFPLLPLFFPSYFNLLSPELCCNGFMSFYQWCPTGKIHFCYSSYYFASLTFALADNSLLEMFSFLDFSTLPALLLRFIILSHCLLMPPLSLLTLKILNLCYFREL